MNPGTLKECFEALDIILDVKIKLYILDSDSEDCMIGFHHGLGTWIRNNWGLWQGSNLSRYFNNLGIEHADDMSGIILTSYWRCKHNKPLNIKEQVKHYQDYWNKTES